MSAQPPEAPSLDGREDAAVAVRRARTSDVPEIKRLVDTYAGKILLEKNLVTLYEAVQEFWVAEMDDRVVGCGALHVLWADLGEVRTVAVDPAVKGRGVGHAIVGKLLEVARELQLQRLFVKQYIRARLRCDASPMGQDRCGRLRKVELSVFATQFVGVALFTGLRFARCRVVGEYRNRPK